MSASSMVAGQRPSSAADSRSPLPCRSSSPAWGLPAYRSTNCRVGESEVGVAAYQARDRRTQISGIRVDSTQWRKVRAQSGCSDLEHPHRR